MQELETSRSHPGRKDLKAKNKTKHNKVFTSLKFQNKMQLIFINLLR